jgi:hypothetical protein
MGGMIVLGYVLVVLLILLNTYLVVKSKMNIEGDCAPEE